MDGRCFARLIGVVAVGGVALVPVYCVAHEQGHSEGHHAETGAKPKAAPAPATAGETWRSVKAREADLAKLIQTKDIEKVHEVAFAIRALVKLMPDQSSGLTPDKLTKLRGSVKYVATLAERLDAAGDAKDQSATEASFKQLQSVLASIEGLYPSEALK